MTNPKREGTVIVILALFLLVGCAAKRPAVKLYHAAYCQTMNDDGQHCDVWATPCGKLWCE